MSNDKRIVLVNGTFTKSAVPVVPVTSRGLMYGDGCFETLRSYKGAFFELNAHLKRLAQGLNYLSISLPDNLQLPKIREMLAQLIKKNECRNEDAVIRLQVWREGDRGYATKSSRSGYAVTLSPLNHSNPSYALATVSTPRVPSAALPSRYKFTNGINYIKAVRQAQQKGADDALMQTLNGFVSETTVANIFWMKKEKIYTPSLDCDVLPGITRKAVLKCLSDTMNRKVEEGNFPVESIKNADLVWICNSVKEIAKVHQIDQVAFNTSSDFFDEMRSVFESYLRKKLVSVL